MVAGNTNSSGSNFPLDFRFMEEFMANSSAEELCSYRALQCFKSGTEKSLCFQNCTFPASTSIGGLSVAIQVVICTLIFIPSLLGNLCVVYVVIRDKRLHTTTNYFLTNLSIAELLITIFNMWPYLIHTLHLFTDTSEASGFLYCRFTRFTQVLGISGCTLTLTLIACDRFFGIVFAMKAHLTERKASVFVGLIWSISVLVSLPILLFNERKMRHWSNFVEIWCFTEFPGAREFGSKLYHGVLIIGFYLYPAIVMTIAYLCIVKRLWTARAPGERLRTEGLDRSVVQLKQRRKVITMLVIILIVFYVCWTPLQLFNLLTQLGIIVKHQGYKRQWISFAFHFLAYSNACFHPIMFAGYNQNFRRAFRNQCPFLCGKHASDTANRVPPNTSDVSSRTGYTRFSVPFVSLQMEPLRRPSNRRASDIKFQSTQ